MQSKLKKNVNLILRNQSKKDIGVLMIRKLLNIMNNKIRKMMKMQKQKLKVNQKKEL